MSTSCAKLYVNERAYSGTWRLASLANYCTYVSTAKSQAAAMLPNRVPAPTLASVFEVVVDGKVYTVKGAALQRWIIKQRGERKGPRGFLFSQRPTLD